MKINASYIAVVITAIFALIEAFLSTSLGNVPYILLILGSVFPGIPHGALDHKLSTNSMTKTSDKIQFILGYLGIMLGVLLLWWWMPDLGVILFILYSAWHFGETDTRSMKIFTTSLAWVFGLSLLVFMLSTHAEEYNHIITQIGSTRITIGVSVANWLSGFSFVGLLLPAIHLKRMNWPIWLSIVLVLVLSIQLPLVMAFALYFIGLHSVKGWMDIHKGLKMGFINMIRSAMPFTLGAFATFLLILIAWNNGLLMLDNWVSVFFAFLAAISLPHIWYMHSFYKRQSAFSFNH